MNPIFPLQESQRMGPIYGNKLAVLQGPPISLSCLHPLNEV